MATKTVLRIPATGHNHRNALVEIQTRVEGAMVTNEPYDIEQVRSGGHVVAFQVTFEDTVPDEEIRAVLKGLANLADRPESGLGRGITFTQAYDLHTDSLQREFSR